MISVMNLKVGVIVIRYAESYSVIRVRVSVIRATRRLR